jgi:hypothetical protein
MEEKIIEILQDCKNGISVEICKDALLNLCVVSQQRELLIAYGEELEGRSLYLEGTTLDKFTDEYLSNL